MTPPNELSPPINGAGAEWNSSTRIRLLLVDDDALFREALEINLTDQQFEVVSCDGGRACMDLLADDRRFNLILLDWRMPEMSGIEVMQEIKAAGVEIPVVFLTAFATERNEVTALDCGAVDFLDKSRTGAILNRRIRILVSNGTSAPSESTGCPEAIKQGRLDIQFRVNRIFWDGRLVPLTTTEFRVVQLLASRAGEDVSYRAIYDVVHGPGFVAGDGANGYRTNVRSLIKRIRQKFCTIDPDFEHIENYPGFGYRWRHVDDLPAGPPDSPAANEAFAAPYGVFGALSQIFTSRSVTSVSHQLTTESSGDAQADGPPKVIPKAAADSGRKSAKPAGNGAARGKPQGNHRLRSGDTT